MKWLSSPRTPSMPSGAKMFVFVCFVGFLETKSFYEINAPQQSNQTKTKRKFNLQNCWIVLNLNPPPPFFRWCSVEQWWCCIFRVVMDEDWIAFRRWRHSSERTFQISEWELGTSRESFVFGDKSRICCNFLTEIGIGRFREQQWRNGGIIS